MANYHLGKNIYKHHAMSLCDAWHICEISWCRLNLWVCGTLQILISSSLSPSKQICRKAEVLTTLGCSLIHGGSPQQVALRVRFGRFLCRMPFLSCQIWSNYNKSVSWKSSFCSFLLWLPLVFTSNILLYYLLFFPPQFIHVYMKTASTAQHRFQLTSRKIKL